ncbi:MAG: hypothetical protein JWO22_2920 [Frankiales bacterium]|nr:hypothetical protein [Frankiales bacterium]
MGLDTALLLQAVNDAQDARDLDELVASVAGELRPRFDLWLLGLVTLRGDTAVVEASWSISESVFEPGTSVAIDITPGIRELVDRTASGRPVHETVGGRHDSMVDHLMEQQGIRAVTLQLVDREPSMQVLMVDGSGSRTLLESSPDGFWAGLAAGIRPRVLEITRLRSG